ncbi:MAG: TonB-dependent receptor [Muribaculaceae bacterium]|nr:TonB-dependent receptor [Muribaculaceae bacterium]
MKRYIFAIIGMLLAVATAAAQNFTVTGTVYEPSGDTAIGASVYEKGSEGHGATTDIDGNFTLKVSSDKATVVVSYIGMQTQEIPLNGRNHIDVTLKESATLLNEVVIVGYGTQKKINATGAVKTIDSEVLESRPLSNAVQGLQGAVAGLNITNDNGGAPGSEMNINIRGVGSIGDGSNASPLVLIDGMEGDLSSINPNDIENISVLKDAAAASIYGSRAPFGVVLVTTKSGSDRGTRVNYSGNVRFQQPVSVPNRVDSYTMALMVNDAHRNSGGADMYIGQGQLDKILAYQRGEIPYGTEAESGTKWKENFASWGNTDWYDVYMKKLAVSQEHNFSVTGGSDKVNYYFSGNYLDQGGIFKFADEKYERLALTGKVGVKFNKYVRFNWTTRLITTKNDKPSALNSLFYHNLGRRYATEPLYLPNGEYHPKSLVPAITEGGREVKKTQQYYNQANLIIEPIKDWMIHAEINSRIENNPYTRQFKPVYVTGPDGNPIPVQVLEGVTPKHVINSNGVFNVYPAGGESYFEKAQTNVNYFSTNFYTDYSLRLKDVHNFKFLVGMQSEYFKNDITRVASTNIVLPEKPFFPSEVGGEGTMLSESKGDWSSLGFFGRVNYNYDDRYMVEVNLRADGASRFPKDQRWSTFPSVSVGWNVAQEKFWESLVQVCNYLKVRGSYGVLGNQNTNSFYQYYQKMTTSGGEAVLGGQQVTVLPVYSPFSTSLTWEKIENAGAGVDFGLLNSRLQGAFDWYQRTTKDMVGPALSLPGVYGGDAPKTNNAEMRTRGWELELSWRDRINADWSYSISASLSDYKSVVTKYDSPTNEINKWYAGKTYGEIWGYEVVGIAKSDKEMADYMAVHPQNAIGNNWGGGDVMYKNQDSDPAINSGSSTIDDHGDLKIIGNSTPRYAYSFTLEANWRFIDFRAYFQGIGKRDYFIGDGSRGTSTFFGFGGGPWQFTPFYDHLDYFRYAGSELGANLDPYFGRLRTDNNNIQYCDRFLQDASYLRLKNLTIGFSLPENTKLSRYVRKARLYFSAENLFTHTKMKIFDPEALEANDGVYSAGAGKAYPQYRTFSVGLELTF